TSEYYNTFTFLEYSKQADAVFCFPCRHFSSGSKDPAFTENGVTDWKNLKKKLQKHSESSNHKQCFERWHLFKQSKEVGSVLSQLSNSHKMVVRENREYAAKVTNLLLYLATQGIALRGHDERQESTNRGNFLELCYLFASYDEAFAKKLSGSFNLTGHVTQNKHLEIAADIVKSNIIEKVQENGFKTILVDEARSFKQEQMTVCVRYTENLEIKQQFLGFVDCSKQGDADAIYQNIKQFLELAGIANIPIVAQCYDGAGVMAGHVNGVQQKMLQDYPTASMAHKLNLVLVEACKVNRTAAGFFCTLETLFTFFS
uniref:TTF-type domain-containing protein n=1 Tax=Latimeria chalumnae TaxID=7897 RepID=H3ADI7_LATCH